MSQPHEVRVEKHLPERRRPKTVTTHCGCCCCCCCCLHSVGGLIGAAVGSSPVASAQPYYLEDEDNPGLYHVITPEGASPAGRAIGVYWLTLLLLSVVIAVTGMPWWGMKNELGIFGVLMVLPAIQGAASLLNLIIVVSMSGTRAELLQVGKIFLGTVIGTMIGIGAMFLSCGGLSLFK